MKMTFALLVPLMLLSVPATPALAGDATAGAQKSAVCRACHGATGSSINPEWPNLAGQHESYIVTQLQSFKQAIRDNPLMMPNAALLSDQDMQDLGAHFASQAPAGLEADPSNYKAGEKLYRGGDTERKLPACIACHGPQGKGNGPARYPALRAQHSVYTYNQLKAFAEGRRRTPTNDIMQVVAARLTDDEMRALASYTQGLR
ncbi:MAG: cytochrome c subfamily [Steroidobacteraceae bacterium]|nr:cytochrome c subfamily [Steroidobacteraceae bacterium]